MSDPNRPGWSDPTQAGYYPPNTDPAYAGQYWGPQGSPQYGSPTGPPLTGPMTGPMTGATQQLPPYWQTAGYQSNQPPPPPQPPKSPRWLWIAAGAAVLLVAALVIALVIVSNTSRESTVVAPPTTTAPPVPRPSLTVPRVPTPSPTGPIPPTATLPTTAAPSTPALPGETSVAPTGTETVIYSVTGEGRAINITYVDTGGVMQTEFNVALPWSKEVSLGAPAKNSASVAVVNVGRDVTCSVSVNGAQVRQRTGRGLTICTGVA